MPEETAPAESGQSLRTRIFHVLWGRMSIVVTRALALIIVAHVLDVADLGRFSFMITLFVLFTVLSSLGIDQAASVLVAAEPAERPRWFGGLLSTTLAIALASQALFTLLYLIPGNPMFEGVSRGAVLVLGVSLLPGQYILSLVGFFTGRERFAVIATSNLLQWGGYLLGVLVWRFAGYTDIKSLLVAFLLPVWITAAMLIVMALRDTRPRFDRSYFWKVISFGAFSHCSRVVEFLHMRLDMLLLRLLAPAEAVGFYSVATNLTEVLLYLPRALTVVLLPRSARHDQSGEVAIGPQFWLMALLATGVGIVTPQLISLVFGAEYLPAVILVRILLPGTVFLGMGLTVKGLLLGRRELGFLLAAGLAVVGLFLLLDIPAIRSYGVLGAVCVSTVLYTLFTIIMLVGYSRLVRSSIRVLFRLRFGALS